MTVRQGLESVRESANEKLSFRGYTSMPNATLKAKRESTKQAQDVK